MYPCAWIGQAKERDKQDIMEFRQLEILVAIVETGSFSRAGERLYLSQPAVTAHINALENELGQQLLIRSSKGVHCTDGGRILYEYALSALHQRECILNQLTRDHPSENQLRIAASSVPAQYLLPELLSSFQRLHSDVKINLIFCDSMEVGRKLKEQQADIGFSGFCSQDSECEYQPIASDRLVVITPNSPEYKELNQEEGFSMERLLTAPMILRESGSGTRREFLEYLRKQCPGKNPNVVAVMEDHLAIKHAVTAGMGISVMSERAAADSLQDGHLLAFPLIGGAVRNLYLMRRKKSRLLGISREFYQFTQERMTKGQK